MTDRRERVAEIVRRIRAEMLHDREGRGGSDTDLEWADRIDALYRTESEPVAWMTEVQWEPDEWSCDGLYRHEPQLAGSADIVRVTPLYANPVPEGEVIEGWALHTGDAAEVWIFSETNDGYGETPATLILKPKEGDGE